MANRHLARSVVLQTLFEWDFRGKAGLPLDVVLKRNVEEFAPGLGDASFAKNLLDGVSLKKQTIDEIISKAAPDWPISRISVVDRNILRMGLYELLFSNRDEVPAKVAINEAIELAKTYGGENSGKFVNGVLGSVYKELGEPGKDAISKRKLRREVPFEEMPVKKLGGAVVFARHKDDIYLALVHDIFGHWTLSKGKLEGDEEVKDGTVREIKEEMGLDIKIVEDLGSNEYVASDPEQGKIRKQVHYFLAESKFTDIKLGPSGGLDDARWFKLSDILDLNFYNDILPIVTKAIHILVGGTETVNK